MYKFFAENKMKLTIFALGIAFVLNASAGKESIGVDSLVGYFGTELWFKLMKEKKVTIGDGSIITCSDVRIYCYPSIIITDGEEVVDNVQKDTRFNRVLGNVDKRGKRNIVEFLPDYAVAEVSDLCIEKTSPQQQKSNNNNKEEEKKAD